MDWTFVEKYVRDRSRIPIRLSMVIGDSKFVRYELISGDACRCGKWTRRQAERSRLAIFIRLHH